ncbi:MULTISPECIES: hypothetical protein [unclassified Pseudoalteromonas]|nr:MULTISPECIES: hypothetical protein [unclassified Pseudoalteromonas]
MGNGQYYQDELLVEFDLNTQQTREMRLKESNIWGMGAIYNFYGVFNIKDE